MSNSIPRAGLPFPDAHSLVCDYLPAKDIGSCALVCKGFNKGVVAHQKTDNFVKKYLAYVNLEIRNIYAMERYRMRIVQNNPRNYIKQITYLIALVFFWILTTYYADKKWGWTPEELALARKKFIAVNWGPFLSFLIGAIFVGHAIYTLNRRRIKLLEDAHVNVGKIFKFLFFNRNEYYKGKSNSFETAKAYKAKWDVFKNKLHLNTKIDERIVEQEEKSPTFRVIHYVFSRT